MNLSPEQLIGRYHAAMTAADADAFADLYAPDGVHEFPFFNPYGVTRLEGPDQIRDFYRPLWSASDVVLDRVQSTALHRIDSHTDAHTDTHTDAHSDTHAGTATDGTVIDELVSIGRRGPDGRPFRLAGLVILTARDGKIVNVRDYLDLMGLAASETAERLRDQEG